MTQTTENPAVTPEMPGGVNRLSTLDTLMRMQRQLNATNSIFSRPSKEFQDIQIEIDKSIKDLKSANTTHIPAEQMNHISKNVMRYGQEYLNSKADDSWFKPLSKRDIARVETVEAINKEMSEMSMVMNRRMQEDEKKLREEQGAQKIQEQHSIVEQYQNSAKKSEQTLQSLAGRGVLSKEEQEVAMSCMNIILAARLMKIAKNVCSPEELEKVGAQMMGKLEESKDMQFDMPETGNDIKRFVDEKQDKAMVDSLFGRLDEKEQKEVEKQAKEPVKNVEQVKSMELEAPQLVMNTI